MAQEVEVEHESVPQAPRYSPLQARLSPERRAAIRSSLIKVLINMCVLAITLPILPGIEIPGATLWTYLGIALTLSLLNRTLRPLLLLFTGQMILWDTFAWLTVINTIVLILTFLIAQVELPLGSLPWLGLDAALLSLVLAVTDALLGFDRPNMDPDLLERAIWRLAERLPTTRRNRLVENLRLAQLYDIFWSYGLEILAGESTLQRMRAKGARWITGRDTTLDRMTVPEKVRLMLEQLGPLYVKLGQVVSSQAATLPEAWRVELDKLQSMVTPFSYAEACGIVRAELGAPPEQLFATFDTAPLAAASTAQVHRAMLQDGTVVVVKVQRPDITAKVHTDLRIMRELAGKLEHRFAWARESDLASIVAEFATGVIRELDYRNEAYHTVRLADAMASVEGVRVPRLYRRLSTSKVLTMEFVSGVKINRLGEQQTPALDRDALVRRFLRAVAKQLLVDGFFHADPHPGNLYVDETGTITFLDLGLTGELSSAQRRDLLDLLFSFQEGDTARLAQVLRRLSRETRPFAMAEFEAAVARIYAQEWTYGDESTFGSMMTTMLAEMSRHGLRLNKGFTLAIKAVIQAEEAVLALAPQSDVFQMIAEETKSLLGAQWTRERVVEIVETQLRRSSKELLRRLPSLADATALWLDQYQHGKLGVELNTGDLPLHIGALSTSLSMGFRKLAIGLAVCGMVIGSALGVGLLRPRGGGNWSDLYAVVVMAFLGVLIFSAVIVTLLLRPSRGHGDDTTSF